MLSQNHYSTNTCNVPITVIPQSYLNILTNFIIKHTFKIDSFQIIIFLRIATELFFPSSDKFISYKYLYHHYRRRWDPPHFSTVTVCTISDGLCQSLRRTVTQNVSHRVYTNSISDLSDSGFCHILYDQCNFQNLRKI